MNDRRATDDRQGMSAAPGHLNSSPDMLATAIAVPPNGRIVVIRLDNIGDVVMTLPLVRELKRRFAGAAIDVVVSPVAADLFRHCPYTGRVIPLLSRRLPRFDVLDQLRRSRRLNREWFAASRPDLAISPRFGPEEGGTAFAAFASRARYRLAYRKPRTLPPLSAWLHDDCFTHLLSPGPVEHEVVKNLAFARALGATDVDDRLEFWLSEGERRHARELLLQAEAGPDLRFVALAPDARVARNCWPADRFAAVARELWRRLGIRSVVGLGTNAERGVADRIVAGGEGAAVSLCGATSLLELGAVLERAALMIGNDSGPGHIAAAVGTRVLTIASLPKDGRVDHVNSPARFRPWGEGNKVLQPEHGLDGCREACLSDEPHCILAIEPPQVVEIAIEMLTRTRENGPRRSREFSAF